MYTIHDWSYLQFAVGALFAKCLIAWRVLPLYHRLGLVTVYQLLAQRYGPHTRGVAAACFALGALGYFLWPLAQAPFIYFQF